MKAYSEPRPVMTFKESERVIFSKNPLEEVICQLKFPTILEISAEQPVKFQNRIRDRFPLYEIQQPRLPKEIEQIVARLPLPMPFEGGQHTHQFSTQDHSKSISLASDFVSFTDNGYDQWESFSQEIERARSALEEIYKPAFYTRIGLRYKDIIDREKLGLKDSWDALLKPSILGLLGTDDGVGKHVAEIASMVSIHLEAVPGAKATIRHGLRTRPTDARQVYVIDMDLHTEGRNENKDVPQILAKFNKMAGNFFRWAITDRLRDALGPGPASPRP